VEGERVCAFLRRARKRGEGEGKISSGEEDQRGILTKGKGEIQGVQRGVGTTSPSGEGGASNRKKKREIGHHDQRGVESVSG